MKGWTLVYRLAISPSVFGITYSHTFCLRGMHHTAGCNNIKPQLCSITGFLSKTGCMWVWWQGLPVTNHVTADEDLWLFLSALHSKASTFSTVSHWDLGEEEDGSGSHVSNLYISVNEVHSRALHKAFRKKTVGPSVQTGVWGFICWQ